MKLAKRIFVAILAVALLVSGLVFASSAEEPYTMADLTRFSEFYLSNTYVDAEFSGAPNGPYSYSYTTPDGITTSTNTNSNTFVVLPTALIKSPDDKAVLTSYLMNPGFSAYQIAAPAGVTLGEALVVNFNVCAPDVASLANAGFLPQNTSVAIQLNYIKSDGVAVNANKKLFEMNLADGQFKVAKWNEEYGVFSDLVPIEGITPTAGTWYNVSFVVDMINSSFTVSIAPNGGTAVSSEPQVINGLAAVTSAAIDFRTTSTTGGKGIVSISDIIIYEGSFMRHLEDKDTATKAAMAGMEALYNATGATEADKLAIADLIYELWQLPADKFDASYKALLPNAMKYLNETYAAEYAKQAAAIDVTAGVHTRYDHAALLFKYYSVFAGQNLDTAVGITPELKAGITAANTALQAEVEAIETVAEHSEAFIEYMKDYDASEDDYALIMAFYAGANADNVKNRDFTYKGFDADFSEEMAEAAAKFIDLDTKVTEINANVTGFINNVEKMKTAATYGALYAAYAAADEIYDNRVIHPRLDITSHADLMAAIAVFEEKRPAILEKKYECDAFIEMMDFAKTASTYTVLVTILGEVSEIITVVEPDYSRVQECIDLYNTLSKSVADSKTAADAYIAAVEAIKSATTYAAKKTAIEAATALKAHGDVTGVEGVEAANVAYVTAVQEINVKEANSKALIALVAELKDATTVSARRAIIRRAQVVAAASEDTYAGVADAKAALKTAVDTFNADVAAANTAIASATNTASAVAAVVEGGAIFVAAAE